MSDELPEGWALATLSNVCDINPPKPPVNALPAEALVTFVPMPAVDAEQGAITRSCPRPFSEVRKGFTAFRNEDVIMAKITPCMENGKAAIARDLLNGLGFGSTEFHVLRSAGAVCPEYVYYSIRQESFRRAAENEMTGSVGQKRVPVAFLEETAIPLPPLPEQQRIVARVEALLAGVNAARKRLAKVPAVLKRFRQSVLAAACSGQLTADWRETQNEVESASDLLSRLVEGRKFPRGMMEVDEESTLPEEWTWATPEKVSIEIVDCPHSTPRWSDSGRVCLRTTNFRPGFLDFSETRYVSEDTYEERIERLAPRPGDVVYSREGGILGIACVIPSGLTACLGQRMMLFRMHEECSPHYFMQVLNAPATIRRVQELTGGTASPHLNVGDIKRFPIPLPPTKEQREIVRRIDALFKLADAIENRVTAATARSEKLTQAILAKAFRGELVPTEAEVARREGRDYEAASALLERILAEQSDNGASREGTEKTKHKRRERTAGKS